MFQVFNLLARTSALENIELPLMYRGLPARERRARARRVLEMVGLTGWKRTRPVSSLAASNNVWPLPVPW